MSEFAHITQSMFVESVKYIFRICVHMIHITYEGIYSYIHVYTYVYCYMHMYMYICICICIYICTLICICICIYICTLLMRACYGLKTTSSHYVYYMLYIYIYIYIHIYIYIYMYIYIYIYAYIVTLRVHNTCYIRGSIRIYLNIT